MQAIHRIVRTYKLAFGIVAIVMLLYAPTGRVQDADKQSNVDIEIRDDGTDSQVLHGEIVKRVFAPRIDSWRVVDSKRIILYITRSKPYLITLRNKAHGLTFTNSIGLRRHSSTIDAQADEIVIDGFDYRIERIEKLTPDVAKRLLSNEIEDKKKKAKKKKK